MSGKAKNIKSNLKHLDTMTDSDIDYSDIPELGDEFWKDAKLLAGGKKAISLRVDEDVLAFYKARGKGYQTVMNKVLRQYMESQKR